MNAAGTKMLRAIVRHEWKVLRADRTLHLVVVLLVSMAAFATYVGRDWLKFQSATMSQAKTDEAERVRGIEEELLKIQNGGQPASPFSDPRLPGTVSNRAGRIVTLPAGPLAGLAIGESDLHPYYFRVSHLTNERSFLANGELENPHNLLTGRFDLAFVIVYLLPLIILALCYNLISGEREEGTLALALSQPVSLVELLRGKLIVRGGLIVGLSLLFALLVGLGTGAALLNGQTMLRLAGVWLVIALYATFWFGLALLVNAFGRSSAYNATALAALWLGLVIVVPTLVQLIAVSLHPAPSRVALVGRAREASRDATLERSRLLSRYYEDHPEMLGSAAPNPANFAALGFITGEEVNRQVQPLLDRFDRQLARQHFIVRRYRFLSPAILANEALNDLAGTGVARFGEFKRQTRQFAEEWKQLFVPRILRADTMRVGVTAGLPSFQFREEGGRVVWARLALPLIGLAILAALTATLAARASARYRMTA
jgi:ABC-2 type transport system permease protein